MERLGIQVWRNVDGVASEASIVEACRRMSSFAVALLAMNYDT